MPRLLFISIVLALSLAARGAEKPVRTTSLSLTLPRAIQLALGKNFQIQVESFSPVIAQEQLRQQSGKFDPTFHLGYTRSEDTTRVVDGNLLLPRPLTLQEDAAEIGLGGVTPWGLSYDVAGATRNPRGTANAFENNFTTNAEVRLTQPLLRGFGPAANLAQVRIARENVRISDWALRRRVIDVVTQIYYVYNELYFAQENLQVALRSRALAQQLLQDNTKRAQIGVMSPLDITIARAEVATREEAVILAERAVKDNANFLKQLVTADIERLLDVRVAIEPPPTRSASPSHVREGISRSLESRPDYQQALLDIRKRNINVAFQRNQALPRLDLVGSLNLLGFDRSLGASISQAVSQNETQWSAGAVFSVPIPNRAGRAAASAAQLEAAQALVDLKRLEQDIVVKVDNALGQVVTARERIESTREARVLAKESLDAGEQKLRAGTSTTFEVLELQKKLSEAEAAELRAQADFNKAVAEYERQIGTTLERNGVVFER